MRLKKKHYDRFDEYLRLYGAGLDFSPDYNTSSVEIIDYAGGPPAIECFFDNETHGTTILICSQVELLTKAFKAKSAINFNIKLWAESRVDGTLPLIGLFQMQDELGLPWWVIQAVEGMKRKIYETGPFPKDPSFQIVRHYALQMRPLTMDELKEQKAAILSGDLETMMKHYQ